MKTYKVVQILSSDRKTILQMKESVYKELIAAVIESDKQKEPS
jgi:hypothetical protein